MNRNACLVAIDYYLPERRVGNDELVSEFPDWNVQKIESKTGIKSRHISAETECSTDLGVMAAEKLFQKASISREQVDFVVFCTETPDYFLPPNSCLVQSRLGLSKAIGAYDMNLGCSGFVIGLSQAKGLIETGQADNVLLICADTYSKLIHPQDRSVRTIFGDAGSAAIIGTHRGENSLIGPFVFGTDGSGAENLIVPMGGFRSPLVDGMGLDEIVDSQGSVRTSRNLFMDGPAIFNFATRVVPDSVKKLLEKSGRSIADIDKFIFHQANTFMLDHLRKKCGIPEDKFIYALEDCGNTVSSSIPIAISRSVESGAVASGDLLLIVGFGVGYSWAGTIVQLP
jgi:3-oxoacyl-[acyl-carrier-protein] synthase III